MPNSPSLRTCIFTVQDPDSIRLDRFLSKALSQEAVSREKIKRAIKNGLCCIEEAICRDPDRRLSPGDTIILHLPEVVTSVAPEYEDITVLYQDEHLLIVNKPAGLTVHPAPSCREGTLVHRLVAHFPSLREQEGFRPGIVHRLDKDTSGLLCVALTEEARLKLIEAFAAREVQKEYLALVAGVPCSGEILPGCLDYSVAERRRESKDKTFCGNSSVFEGVSEGVDLPSGRIDIPLGRHPTNKIKVSARRGGKRALSDWSALLIGGCRNYSLLSVRIHTGRTHQIRVHMAFVGHPLLGDSLYGSSASTALPAPRQMLHAWKLTLQHPVSGETLRFTCPPPPEFLQTALSLESHMQRIVVTSVAGCGKSAFMRILANLNIPTWSADAAVIRLYEPGHAGWLALRQRFGDRFIPSSTEPVDRAALAKALLPPELPLTVEMGGVEREQIRVRTDELEALIHPLVLDDLQRFWAECESRGCHIAVAEVPLWFESNWHVRNADVSESRPLLVGISCQEDERRRRLLEVRGWSPSLMAHMDAQQWSQERKMAACDIVIPNNGTEEELHRQALAFLKRVEQIREQEKNEFQDRWNRLTHSVL